MIREKVPHALDALRHVSFARRVNPQVRCGICRQFEHLLVSGAGGEAVALIRKARRVVRRLTLERDTVRISGIQVVCPFDAGLN